MEEPQNDFLDLDSITTSDELLNFIFSMKVKPTTLPCDCGMTDQDFKKTKFLGCPKCYGHFDYKIKKICRNYHGAVSHIGKKPKRFTENNPIEKLKLLKLKYAKALELEEYEKLADLKHQIDELI